MRALEVDHSELFKQCIRRLIEKGRLVCVAREYADGTYYMERIPLYGERDDPVTSSGNILELSKAIDNMGILGKVTRGTS